MAINQELVDLFCKKAGIVGAKTFEAKSIDDAVDYIVDICEQKAPCELLANEEGTKEGPLSSNNLPTRLERIIAIPDLDGALQEKIATKSEAKGFMCIKSGLHKHLAGLDVGVAMAQKGVAASGTCLVVSDNEESRLATMISELSVLILNKSDIHADLLGIANYLRQLQSAGSSTFTAFITGPSRTADIERVLAIGVHGPLELHIILLEA